MGEGKGLGDDAFQFEQRDAIWVVGTMVVNGPEGLLKNERNSHAGLAGPGNVPASPPSPPILSPRGMRRLKGQDSGGDSR